MLMLLSEETMPARIFWGNMTAQLEIQPGDQNNLITKRILTYCHCHVLIHHLALSKHYTLKLQSIGILKVKHNLFGERWFAVKVISFVGITSDHETGMLILTMYLKVFENVKYFIKIFKYIYFSFVNVKYKYNYKSFEKVFKYFQIQM